ncbi:hypothetical protein [Pseudonocardia parietis]|uniref:Uncharacterized protein n=1 Tax=Pseudonocardia parietis TaxID=570936 RepID=A0ABS4VRM9_9PSEU|nr:hypothetical protein [Pseudonocardia parietis]MBP2366571.1 hypothetical protein [Pseudonocardia parietis]
MTGIPQAPPVLRGRRVHRIHWVLGTDLLCAVCHCGAEQLFDDPVVLWEWLLGHPDGHHPGVAPTRPALEPAGAR